ncbi:conserved hypothetical protein [uncultured Paludibacter sp.]|nr:conserved hypothetical protein [uncultured Paludibacter sp.]
MMKHLANYFLYSISFCVIFFGCKTIKKNDSASMGNNVSVNISSEILNANYLGNGVEWDPYDEAEAWGTPLSDADWEKLFKRVNFMKMPYVRCMINSPYKYYNKSTGKYDKTRNLSSLSKLLRYCTENNITVIYGEYNPPDWSMNEDDKWVEMSVDYLNYLVNDLGFSCIKYFVIFNEPDGYWASTNGNYEIWKKMAFKFTEKMKTYPGLFEKVKLAAPDVVMDYKNNASLYDAPGWVSQSAKDMDNLIGIYDVHAYPGQAQLRNGEFPAELLKYKKCIPSNKRIVLGEAGYKYWRAPDAKLMEEYNKRAKTHPYTKGTDANMFVYDFFYGLDMPLLCMEVMNNGFSGVAAWMLDDAMHSNGDSGVPKDIKLWGMWNILGEELFKMPEEENIRPWYYTWSLMCRYFPQGCNLLKFNTLEDKNIRFSVAEFNGKITFAAVNFGDTDKKINLKLPRSVKNGKMYIYEENNRPVDKDNLPIPVKTGINIKKDFSFELKAQSFALITNLD